MQADGWIGVDLDGTLAYYDVNDWRGIDHIGAPIGPMVDRVRAWLADGFDVRIFTARVASPNDRVRAELAIFAWCQAHLGRALPVTCCKDYGMIELWDDRCVQVIPNTGQPLQEVEHA